MAEERTQRRLVAILVAEVVTSSRPTKRNDVLTLAVFESCRKAMLDPLFVRYAGRVLRAVGDGVLVEFANAVNAVQCAIELQQGMAAVNRDHLDERRIMLGVAVNLGEVWSEDAGRASAGDIAIRLVGLAEPGDILISGSAYDHVRNKITAAFEDLGARNLKNIFEPVRVYRIAGMP